MLPLFIILRNRCLRVILLSLFLLSIQPGVQAQSSSVSEDTLLFREGEGLLSNGETEKALWRFRRLTTDFPNSPLLNETKFRMGVCYTRLKRHKDAIRVLNEILSTFLSPSRMVEVLALLGDNHLELKDRHNALMWYGKGLLVPKQSHEELRKKVRSIIDTFDAEGELNQIESLFRGAYGGGYAKFKLAQLAKRRGDERSAKRILLELEKEYGQVDFSLQAKEPPKEPPAPVRPPSQPAKYKIGVILPLSGMHQHFGERALEGIQLALKNGGLREKTPFISLVVRDSQGNPDEAEKALEELVTKEKVIAVIGPILSNTADRATRKAQQLKIPLITLSQKESLTGKGGFIVQNSLTPSAQIQGLVEFATKQSGHRTFAVFYPNSPYGLHFRNLFTQEVGRKGGKVLGAVAYLETQTDFGQEIKGFFKIEPVPKSGSQKKDEEFKIGFPVDGLFIPDTHDRVSLILSQMAYYDVKGIALLGNNGWNHPRLLSVSGESAEGAVFVDAFFRGDAAPGVARFVEAFQKHYRRDPETLEALAYEAAELLREVLHSKSPASPLQLKEEIYQIRNFQGVAGLRGFGENGKVIRDLSILRVNQGKIEVVTP
jgi:ABC-type branched-subunit amino acid transport system substrate-binding protein